MRRKKKKILKKKRINKILKKRENKEKKLRNINEIIEGEIEIGKIIGNMGATKKIFTSKAKKTLAGIAAIVKEMLNILAFKKRQ